MSSSKLWTTETLLTIHDGPDDVDPIVLRATTHTAGGGSIWLGGGDLEESCIGFSSAGVADALADSIGTLDRWIDVMTRVREEIKSGQIKSD